MVLLSLLTAGRPGATPAVVSTVSATIVVHVPDLDGSQPDIWRFIEEVRENDLQADPAAYR